MIARSAPAARTGFTLLECVLVFGALALCMALGTTLILTAVKAEQMGVAAANRISQRQELVEQFREDVARAATAPEKLGAFTAGPSCLILQAPGGSTIVYHWKDGALERIDRAQDKPARRLLPVGPIGTTIEFSHSKTAAAIVTLRITEPSNKNGPARRSELQAALGGNLK
jgi:hypothetical protein